MVFDVKVKDFRHKAMLAAGGHMTKAPVTVMHASIVILPFHIEYCTTLLKLVAYGFYLF